MTAHAIIQQALGGPEVLQYRAIDLDPPGHGEVRLRHSAIGVNYHDIYNRDGRNRALALPDTHCSPTSSAANAAPWSRRPPAMKPVKKSCAPSPNVSAVQ